MLNVLTKNPLNYGWVGANQAHFERSLGENDVTFHLMTSSKIYQRKVEINILLMFGSSFLSF